VFANIMIEQKLINEYNATRATKASEKLCHAPFVNMNFEQNGDVTACCFNRTHVLGSYPKMSLLDIWFSSKADELRNYIDANDLGGGCEICAKQLLAHNFMGSRARGFDENASSNWENIPEKLRNKLKHGQWQQMPRSMEFELSNTCNLECVMCHGYFSSTIRKNREHLPPIHQPYDEGFVEQLKSFLPYLQEAKFLGGEPFLIDIYYQIWEAIAEVNPNINIYITTNATVYNNKVRVLLNRLKVNPVISIDSLVEGTYNVIRKNASFIRVMENIGQLRAYCQEKGTQLSFAVCPMTLNKDELPAMVQYANKEGIRLFFNTVFQPEIYSLKFLQIDELTSLIETYKQTTLSNDNEIARHNASVFNDLVNQLEAWLEQAQSKPFKISPNTFEHWSSIKASVMAEPWQITMLETTLAHLNNHNGTTLEQQLEQILAQQGAQQFVMAYFEQLEWLYTSFTGNESEQLKDKMFKLKSILTPELRYEFIASELIRMRPDQLLETIMEFSTERLLHEVNVRFNS
jgi:MoaA/NifB/PqqE/SkfB family radical SAM enzyme